MSMIRMPRMRRFKAVAVLVGLLSAGTVFAISAGVPSAAPTVSPSSPPKPNSAAKSPTNDDDPRWNELKPQQQQILEPLSSEWNKMDAVSRQKWLKIAGRFSKATPEELQRIHARMQEWLKLTPEQKRIIRENSVRAKKLDPAQKSATWQQYQNLPEDQKKKLAASAAQKKHIANLPPHGIAKPLIPPIKSPKKVQEKSTTPGPVHVAPLQVTPAPTLPNQP